MMRHYERRLCQLEAQYHPPWWQSQGLAALLDAARTLHPPEPWDLPALDEAPTGLGRLLQEARAWHERQA
jgi:hypothetical protein